MFFSPFSFSPSEVLEINQLKATTNTRINKQKVEKATAQCTQISDLIWINEVKNAVRH